MSIVSRLRQRHPSGTLPARRCHAGLQRVRRAVLALTCSLVASIAVACSAAVCSLVASIAVACSAVACSAAVCSAAVWAEPVVGETLQEQPPATQETPPAAPDKPAGVATAGDDGWVSLLAVPLDEQWKFHSSDEKAQLADVWTVQRESDDAEPVLVCKAAPKGFLYTTAEYSDFEMLVEWKYPSDANGNSGVLVYTQDEMRVWPTSIQIQFHQPKAGSIFPSGDAHSENTSEAELARPVNEWNECRIISRGGTLSVELNGRKAGEITGATPAAGRIALQSEGSEVHFRRMRIRRLPPLSDGTTPESLPTSADAEQQQAEEDRAEAEQL